MILACVRKEGTWRSGEPAGLAPGVTAVPPARAAAIARLRAVHARIAPALEEAGIPLLAQHVDPMDNATLVDIFRTEENSCLLGTDAMRDGVDVPGRALRHGGVRAGALAAPRHPAPRTPRAPVGRRSGRVRRPHRALASAPGVRPADPQRHRPRRVPAARPPDAEPAAVGFSAGGGGGAGRAGAGGCGDTGVSGITGWPAPAGERK